METEDYFVSYEEWRDAITNRCGIALTPEYCEQRIKALLDTEDSSTAQFIKLFGVAYRDRVVNWFKKAGSS